MELNKTPHHIGTARRFITSKPTIKEMMILSLVFIKMIPPIKTNYSHYGRHGLILYRYVEIFHWKGEYTGAHRYVAAQTFFIASAASQARCFSAKIPNTVGPLPVMDAAKAPFSKS